MMWNNSTIVNSEGTRIVVDQGPTWLVAMLYTPPWWLRSALLLLALATVGIAAVAYRRNGGVDPEVIREASENAIMALSMGLCTHAFVSTERFRYAQDVGLGVLSGFLLTTGLIYGIDRMTSTD